MKELSLNETHEVSGGFVMVCLGIAAITLGAAAAFGVGMMMSDDGCCCCC